MDECLVVKDSNHQIYKQNMCPLEQVKKTWYGLVCIVVFAMFQPL